METNVNKKNKEWITNGKFDPTKSMEVITKTVRDYRPDSTNLYLVTGKLTFIFQDCLLQRSGELGCKRGADWADRFRLSISRQNIDPKEHRHIWAGFNLYDANNKIRNNVKRDFGSRHFVTNDEMERLVTDYPTVTFGLGGRQAEMFFRQLVREVSHFILLCYGDNNTKVPAEVSRFYEDYEQHFWLPEQPAVSQSANLSASIDASMLADNRGNMVLPIMFCLDDCINMDSAKLELMRDFVNRKVLGQMRKGDDDNLLRQAAHVGIVTLGGRAATLALPFTPFTDAERSGSVADVLSRLRPFGRAHVEEGISLAMDAIGDYHNKKKGEEGLKVLKAYLLLVSDGSFPLTSRLVELSDTLRSMPQTMVDVWAVAVGPDADLHKLTRLVPKRQVMKVDDDTDEFFKDFLRTLHATTQTGTAVGNFHVSGESSMQ